MSPRNLNVTCIRSDLDRLLLAPQGILVPDCSAHGVAAGKGESSCKWQLDSEEASQRRSLTENLSADQVQSERRRASTYSVTV